MHNTLKLAKDKNYDVFNCLDVQENADVLKELKFGVGDGNLHYYLYNWRIQKLAPQDLGIVLV
jgi:glycylpeptide N-tetradecanoyltransferase